VNEIFAKVSCLVEVWNLEAKVHFQLEKPHFIMPLLKILTTTISKGKTNYIYFKI
jgi:hypothetical protein